MEKGEIARKGLALLAWFLQGGPCRSRYKNEVFLIPISRVYYNPSGTPCNLLQGHVGKYSKSHWAFGIWTKSLWTTPNQFSLVSTPLKNISQIGSFPQVGVKIKNLWNHHLAINFDMKFRRRIFRWIPKNCLSDQREGSSLIRKYDSSPNGPVYLTPPKKNHTWMSQEVRKRLVSVGCNPNST